VKLFSKYSAYVIVMAPEHHRRSDRRTDDVTELGVIASRGKNTKLISLRSCPYRNLYELQILYAIHRLNRNKAHGTQRLVVSTEHVGFDQRS